MLNEEAIIVSILGVDVYAYGLCVALGAALCLLWQALLYKKAHFPKGSAALTGVWMLVCGFVCARLLYSLTDGAMRQVLSLRAILAVNGGGYSMFGALLGAMLGAWLSARRLKMPAGKVLDCAAGALMLFVACERFGERFTEIGISRPLVGGAEGFSFFISQGEYDSYIATYMIEGILALLLFAWCAWDLRGKHKPGYTAAGAALLFGASQIVMESLRFDQHMKFSFVGVQQILSVLLVVFAVVFFGVSAVKKGRCKKLATASYVYLAVLTGALIGLEFLIDRSGLSRLMLYGVYILLVLVPCVLGLHLRRAAEKE